MRNQAIVLTILLVIHHIFAIIHGDAHTGIPVILSSAQNTFVYLVILLLPIIAVVLVWTRFATIGLWLLLLSMIGSFAFDVFYHYIIVSPDNIAHLPQAPAELHSQFIWTAHALTIMQALGAGVALYFLRGRRAEKLT